MKLVIDFVLVIGIVLSILPIIGIMRLEERKTPQYILVVFWALILNIIVYFYAMLHELETLQFLTNFLQHGLRFFVPPLFYVYVKSIFLEDPGLIRKNLKHFVVFTLFFLGYVVPNSFYPYSEYVLAIERIVPNWAVPLNIFGVIYFLMALRLFYKFRDLVKQDYSNIGEEGFLWIEKFLISFLLVVVVDLIITFTEIAIGVYVQWDAYITMFFLVVAMAYLGYYGLTQSTVFLPPFLIEGLENKSTVNSLAHSYLKPSEKEELLDQFNRCMEVDQLYLSQNLSSKSLALAMDTSERKLSAYFKEVLQSNFYDSINAYRVEEAKRILQSEALKNHSITGIADSCGFSSKSSFYRVFKKSTNLTPLAYVKKNKLDSD